MRRSICSSDTLIINYLIISLLIMELILTQLLLLQDNYTIYILSSSMMRFLHDYLIHKRRI